MVDDISEFASPSHQESSLNNYLEKIGPTDKENVRKITQSFVNTLENDGSKGFIYSVGSTTLNSDVTTSNDIDLLVGVEKDLGDLSFENNLRAYQKRYKAWKEVLDKALAPLIDQGATIQETPVYPDHERQTIAANDGKITLKFPTGRVIELLCHQGTEIDPSAIELFTNKEKPLAA